MLHYGFHWSEKLRVAPTIVLTHEQKSELTRLARSKRTSVRLAQRAQIVLLAAQGMQNKDIAEQLGIGRAQAARWRERYLQSVYRRLRLSCCSAPQTRRLQKKLRSTRSVCLTQRLRPSRPADERSAMCLTRFQPCASSLLKPSSAGSVDAPVAAEVVMEFDTVRLAACRTISPFMG
jgi:hypothetical protein